MFTVTFYKFSKRSNSTKRPSDGTSFDCALKAPSGVVDPVIVLQDAYTARPDFNYAYIPAFDRYYWIEEWTFEHGGLWAASMRVDPLASWKTAIGNQSFYVLRSSAESNGRVIDSKYPTLAQPSSYVDNMSAVVANNPHTQTSLTVSDFWSRTVVTGYYYMGISAATGTGVKWYCMNSGGFQTLMNELFNYTPQDMDDVSEGIAKQFADPMQYIVGCYWFPLPPLGITSGSINIPFGHYQTSLIPNVYQFDPTQDIMNFTATFPIRKHPQAAARGAYLNQSPFTKYRVGFYPFGTFDLDSSLMIDDSTVTAKFWLDYTTGEADLVLSVTNTFVGRYSATLGVPVRVSQATVDYVGGARSLVQAGGGLLQAAGSLLFGGFGGMVSGAASAVGGFMGASQAASPTISSIGGGGNFLPYNSQTPKLYTDFYPIADEYNADIGRPLCAVRMPKNIPGYIQTLEGELDAAATRAELDMISGYLTGGFFYE